MSFLKKFIPIGIRRPRYSAAISWNDGILRAIKIATESPYPRIDAYSERELAPDTIIEGRIANRNDLLDALRDVQKKFNIENAHVLLPEEEAYVFHTNFNRLPGASPDAERGAIEDHLRSYITLHQIFPGVSVSCEYDIVHETSEHYDLHVSVLSDRVVADYRDILRAAGIHPLAMEISAHHVSKHCSDLYSGGIILVDFGKYRTMVALSHQGKIIDRTIIPFGYENFFRIIEKFLQVNRQEAEYVLSRHGLLPTHYDKSLLSELTISLSPITQSIDRLIENNIRAPYRPALLRFEPRGVVLYGNGSWVRGIHTFFQTSARLPVTAYAPIGGKIAPDNALILPAEKALTFGPTVSLALAHID